MTDNKRDFSRVLTALILLLFFLSTFLLFTGPIIEGDFFWHLKTGEWIWQNKSLPEKDPFATISPQDGHNDVSPVRASFILKQYWLAQLLFYGAWNFFGAAGIIVMRAGLYTLLVALVLLMTARRSSLSLALLFTLPLAMVLTSFSSDRPQIFSFLFSSVVLYLLEEIRELQGGAGMKKKVKQGGRSRFHITVFLLPAVMLLWANVHGGYILGVVVLILYGIGETITSLTSKTRVPLPFLWLCAFSAGVTLLNPNTYHIGEVLLAMRSSHTASIQEYLSPVTAALELHEHFIPYFAFLAVSAVVLVLNFRKMSWSHLLVLLFLGGLSLTGLRYMPFFLMTSPLLAGHITWRESWGDRAAVALVFFIWIITADKNQVLQMKVGEQFPAKAVEFVRDQRPAGGIFNLYQWGGYLLYSLPGYDIFIDGRVLSENRNLLYEKALWGNDWRPVFDNHAITLVIMPGMSPVSGEIFPLAVNLMMDPDWSLVYRDTWCLVFARATDKNRMIVERFAMRKELIYEQILSEAATLIQRHPKNPAFWRARADALLYRGDFAGALQSYRMVLKLSPGDERAKNAIKQFGQ